MKKVVLFLSLMMMNLFCFSQEGFIKKIILNGDTGAFVPMKDVRSMNQIIVDLDECKEINDTLNVIIKKYDKAYDLLSKSLDERKMESIKKDSIILYKDKIIDDQKILLTRKEWDFKFAKIQRNMLIGGVAILTSIIVFKK